MKPLGLTMGILVGIQWAAGQSALELAIERTGTDEVTLTWEGTGILEKAPDLTGPWVSVPEAVSGWKSALAPSPGFFRLRSAFLLTVQSSGSGTGRVESNPPGLNCGTECQALFDEGSTVTLTATAGEGSTFEGWSGDFEGTEECVLVMDAPQSVTATFSQPAPSGGFINGGFESGPGVGWQEQPAQVIFTAAELGVPVFSGQYAAWLGFAADDRYSAAVGQTVALPNSFPLYLNFAIWLYSEESCDVPWYDTFGVYANGEAIEENDRLCQGNTGGDGWRTISLDISLLAGQEVLIGFEISSIGTLASVALIDEVHLSNTPW